MGTGPIRSWMDKTLEPAELILFSWSDWELWTDLRRCMRRDSDGGERPERLLVCSHSPRFTDMCWSTPYSLPRLTQQTGSILEKSCSS